IKSISSLTEACKKFKGKLLVNEDLVYYFKDCSLHLIADSQLINTLVQEQDKTPLNMSHEVYAALPVGKNYEYTDYYAEYVGTTSANSCKNLNKKIISLDDYNYYYVENCKKRKFNNYAAVQEFNVSNDPVYSVSQFELNSLSNGAPFSAKTKAVDIKEVSESDLQNKLPNKSILCKNLNGKVTAFHESFYYVEKCTLRPISSFTISLQTKIHELGGVQDLTIEQALGLEEGKELTSAEVISKLR
ncbi:MAG: hypothetical protein V4591_00015, partial [Bdellovibrionota bacterium]